jgi:hypothetical protein
MPVLPLSLVGISALSNKCECRTAPFARRVSHGRISQWSRPEAPAPRRIRNERARAHSPPIIWKCQTVYLSFTRLFRQRQSVLTHLMHPAKHWQGRTQKEISHVEDVVRDRYRRGHERRFSAGDRKPVAGLYLGGH